MKTINIAVDGPSGAGKSTVCRKLSEDLGFLHLDTGALYRSVGVYMLKKGVETTDSEKVIEHLSEIKIDLEFKASKQYIYVNGEDYTEIIRKPEASMAASNVSAIPEVRSFLLELQRSIARNNNVIMDGRDIGTVILPDADIKIFLTATPEDRAKRRCAELKAKGYDVSYENILEEMIRRDRNDSSRKEAPLRKADDAIDFLNTDGFEESYSRLLNIVKGMIINV